MTNNKHTQKRARLTKTQKHKKLSYQQLLL